MRKRIAPAERRAQILDAAVTVILSKGLALATTRDVTEALGVSTGLLFRYFPSWAELRAEAFAAAARNDLEDLFAALADEDLHQGIHRFVAAAIPPGESDHWRLWLDAGHEARSDPLIADAQTRLVAAWREHIADALNDAMEMRQIPPLDVDATAWRVLAMMDGLADYVLMPGSRLAPAMAQTLLYDFICREVGLTTPVHNGTDRPTR